MVVAVVRTFRKAIARREIKLCVCLWMKSCRRLRGTYQRQLKVWCVIVLDAIGEHRPWLRKRLLRFLCERTNARGKQKSDTAFQCEETQSGTLLAYHCLISLV